jgi:hypothetical protein
MAFTKTLALFLHNTCTTTLALPRVDLVPLLQILWAYVSNARCKDFCSWHWSWLTWFAREGDISTVDDVSLISLALLHDGN